MAEIGNNGAKEIEILVEFYNATGGTSWKLSYDWCKSTTAMEFWHGVTTSANQRVLKLNLPNNNLSSNIPGALGGLYLLQHLDLSGNQFVGNIPSTLGQLDQMQYLNLSKNKLTGSIPEELGNLVQLNCLNLNDNQLSGNVPDSLGNLTQMQLLHLENNCLSGRMPASTTKWKINIKVDLDGNGDFDDNYQPWKQRVGNMEPGKLTTPFQLAGLFSIIVFGYLDIITDILSSQIFYERQHYGFFSMQIVFFAFPCLLLAVYETGGLVERFYILSQLRLFVEIIRSVVAAEETSVLLTMQLFETMFESIPSAMLQLVSIFSSKEKLFSASSVVLWISVTISVVVIGNMLFRYFNPYPSAKLSVVLVQVYHVAEVVLRLVMFVAVFASTGSFGFIFLGLVLLNRGMSICCYSNEGNFAMITSSFLLTASDCAAEKEHFDNAAVAEGSYYYYHFCTFVEFSISMIILFSVDGSVNRNRKSILLYAGLVAYVVKVILAWDRLRNDKKFNNLVVWLEGVCLAGDSSKKDGTYAVGVIEGEEELVAIQVQPGERPTDTDV